MKRLIWLPMAGFLLIAGAAAAAAAPGVADRASALLAEFQQDGSSPSPSAGTGSGSGSGSDSSPRLGTGPAVGDRESLLDEVLAELVSGGVITQEQSDAITQALTDKAEQRRAEFEAERERLQQMWTQIEGFLEDDVITSDEIAELPADNPFSTLQDILSDGQITVEELQSVAPFGGRFFDGPHRFGPSGPGGAGGPGHHERWFFEPDADSDTDAGSNSDS